MNKDLLVKKVEEVRSEILVVAVEIKSLKGARGILNKELQSIYTSKKKDKLAEKIRIKKKKRG